MSRNLADLMQRGEVEKPPRLLDADAKEALADAGTPFSIKSIQMGTDDEYGAFWEVSGQLDQEPIQFRLSAHDRRDSFMQSLAAVTATGPIDNCRLRAVSKRGGNAFIVIEPA